MSLSELEAYLSLGVVSSSLNICTVSVLDEQARNSPQGEKDRLYIVAVRFNPLRNSYSFAPSIIQRKFQLIQEIEIHIDILQALVS